jgi:hypothetical protein
MEKLPAFLHPFAAALHEQQPQQQQQQLRQQRRQQQRHQQRMQEGVQRPLDDRAGNSSFERLSVSLWLALGHMMDVWAVKLQQLRTAMPDVGRAALPLLQQLQRCGPLLPFSAAAGGTGCSSNTAPAGSPTATSVSLAYFSAQLRGLQLAREVADVVAGHQPGSAAHQQAWQLISDPAVKELAMQQLILCAALAHREFTEQQQQQQQQQEAEGHPPGSSSNTSNSSGRRTRSEGSTSCNAQKQQQQQQQQQSDRMRADLLPVPAFYQDLLPLLPGGQAYVDGMAATVVSNAQF